MKRPFVIVISLIVLVCATHVAQIPSTAEELDEITGMKFVQMARGGLLYDNWIAELGRDISATHPGYSGEGKIKGPDTWRCVECHGWDYNGRSGAYATGAHYTGIVGIRKYAKKDPARIATILRNDTHAFGDMLSPEDYEALALFVANGQVDVDQYIDRRTRKSKGDIANGGRIYLATCTRCHGTDGKGVVFKNDTESEYLGTMANKNPWGTLHKIRWGHPGTPMVSLVFLDLEDQLDVLMFCQSLPKR